MENEYCVYMHTAPNGKKYIGITCCYPRNRRWQNGYGYVNNKHFFRAIQKYEWINFKHEILEDNLSAEEAGRLEKEYIKKFNTTDREYGYNHCEGGEVGYHLSNETKRKLSIANSGKNNGMYGHHYSDEEKRYMSEHSVWKGRKHTEETRRKISEYAEKHPEKYSHKGKEHPMAKAVLQYDKNGRFIKQYETAADASLKTGVQRSCICVCAKGKTKTAGGYIWKYKDEMTGVYIEPVKPHRYNYKSADSRKRKINQYTTDGILIRTFNSITDANKSLGLKENNGSICGVARGDRKTAHGFIWRYADVD